MSSIYGQTWDSRFKNDGQHQAAVQEWADAVGSISEETLARVIRYLRDEANLEFPPSLSSFMGLCRQFRVEPPKPLQLPKPVSERHDGKTIAEHLETAQRKASERKLSDEDYQALLERHAQLLAADRSRGHIRGVIADGYHLCAYGGCRNAGTLSSATAGGGTFYCSTHFKLT